MSGWILLEIVLTILAGAGLVPAILWVGARWEEAQDKKRQRMIGRV